VQFSCNADAASAKEFLMNTAASAAASQLH
jgi:hypothetical protein